MRALLLVCAVASLVGLGVCSANSPVSPEAFTSQFKMSATKSRRETGEYCSDVSLVPLKWVGLELVNDNTSEAARSYYENFNTTMSRGRDISKVQLSIEYKSPEVIPTGDRKVTINWNNLLFTSSLFVQKKSQSCQSYPKSYLGFVELIKTDKTWYKNRSTGIEHKEWNLAKHDDLQYVMTKPSQRGHYILADDKAVLLYPVNYNRVVPLKYESHENLTIDFNEHPELLEYEKLVEKKIFIVQIGQSGRVVKVIAGVDVMMYLRYQTYGVTNSVHLHLNKNHSLVQWLVNAEKYLDVLNDEDNHKLRDRKLTWTEVFQNPSTVTLNPLLNRQHIM